MQITFRAVPREEVAGVWPGAWAVLAPAVALWHGRYDEPSLRAKVDTADAQLWIVEADGRVTTACLTEIAVYPTGYRECLAMVAGGEGYDLWPDWMEAVKGWAASVGCQAVTCVNARKGFERVLSPAGFRHGGVSLVAELQDGQGR